MKSNIFKVYSRKNRDTHGQFIAEAVKLVDELLLSDLLFKKSMQQMNGLSHTHRYLTWCWSNHSSWKNQFIGNTKPGVGHRK